MRVNLNADVGEGHDDVPLLAIVDSANVACGLHAGDPSVMHRTVEAAVAAGVTVGAHVSFADPEGFGRRPLEVDPYELEHLVAYQLGALQAIATRAGTAVTHLKAHGALYTMAAHRDDYAAAIARAVASVDASITYVGLAGSAMLRAAEAAGLHHASEAFADRTYDDDGRLTPRAEPGAVITDPAHAAERAVAMVLGLAVPTRPGGRRPTRVDTLCIHGDEPGAVAVGEAVRTALERAGIELVSLAELRSS